MKRKKEYATDVLKREIEERKRTTESYDSRIMHCPICRTLCEIKSGDNDISTYWLEPLDKDEQIEILKKENWDLKMNQQVIEQAIIQMREMFPEQWDKALDEYKRKYGLIK